MEAGHQLTQECMFVNISMQTGSQRQGKYQYNDEDKGIKTKSYFSFCAFLCLLLHNTHRIAVKIFLSTSSMLSVQYTL